MRPRFILATALIAVAFGTCSAQGDPLEQRAIERARNFVRELIGESLDRYQVADRFARADGTMKSYLVEFYRSDTDFVGVGVYEDGRVYGFSDLGLAELVRQRRSDSDRTIESEAAALVVAQRYARLAGLDVSRLDRVVHKRVFADRAGIDDRNNSKDRWLVELQETVSGYEGAVNTLGVTVDTVTGGIIMANGGFGTKFEPAVTELGSEQAIIALRQLFDSETGAGKALGNNALAWPGDNAVRPRIARVVYSLGTACGGSDHGARLRERNAARPCFKVAFMAGGATVGLVVDAETGEPVDAYLVKVTGSRSVNRTVTRSSETEGIGTGSPDQERSSSSSLPRTEFNGAGSATVPLLAALVATGLAVAGAIAWLALRRWGSRDT